MKNSLTSILFKDVRNFNSEQKNILWGIENNEKVFFKLPRNAGMSTLLATYAFTESIQPDKKTFILSQTVNEAHHAKALALEIYYELQKLSQLATCEKYIGFDFDVDYKKYNSMIVIKTKAGESIIEYKTVKADLRGHHADNLIYDNPIMDSTGDKRSLDDSALYNQHRVDKIVIAGGSDLNSSLWSSRGYIDAKFGNLKQIYKELDEIG